MILEVENIVHSEQGVDGIEHATAFNHELLFNNNEILWRNVGVGITKTDYIGLIVVPVNGFRNSSSTL